MQRLKNLSIENQPKAPAKRAMLFIGCGVLGPAFDLTQRVQPTIYGRER